MEEARAVGAAEEDVTLTTLIVAIHDAHKGRYGIDRIHADLARNGYRVSPKRVRRLARAAGLRCVHPRPYKATTVPDPANACGLVNLVGRDFVPGAKDQLWYGDITYIFTMSGWAYLATVIDGYSRKVVGWSVADHMREELVIDAFRMAVANRRPGPNTTYLGHARSYDAVTWDFVLVWRRRGTPARRWVSGPRLSQESLVRSYLPSVADASGAAEFPVPGLRRERSWSGPLACGFAAGRSRWRAGRRWRASWRCSAARW